MAGKVKVLIDKVIDQRSKGNPTLASTTRTKLTLKGIDPNQWKTLSPDDPQVIERVKQIAAEWGITL